MASGHLYVLSNPAMPGLIKVGKTTRDPLERLAELSSATGVPSPFVLVFHQPVVDCDYAEKWVHFELERNGFRVTSNREFFNAPLHEIVRIVSMATSLCDNEGQSSIDPRPSNSESTPAELAKDLFELGSDYYTGTETVLRNYTKAFKCFEQAAGMGHAASMSHAASMLHGGLGVPKDLDQALSYFNAAVASGRWWELGSIAEVFLTNEQFSSAASHYKKLFVELCDAIRRGVELKALVALTGPHVHSYCFFLMRNQLSPVVPATDLIFAKDVIFAGAQNFSASMQIKDPTSKSYYDQQANEMLRFVETQV